MSTLERYRPFIDDWGAFTAAASREEPTVFRVRTGVVSEEVLLHRLTERGFRLASVDGMPGFHQVTDGPVPLSMTPEHWLGLVYVQQASTGVAAPALGPRPGERVLDLCSAPGGKTLHMAELMEDTGCLVANEISEGRIRGLLGNVYRLGNPGIMVVAGDGRDFPEGALFDRVLVDAPCTGEGTLRRRGGHPPEPSDSFVAHLARVQRALLTRAVRLTRAGGHVLYVTCTFAPEENEAVVHDVLAQEPVELEPLDLPVPHAPGLTRFEGRTFDDALEGAARIYPHHLDSGGLFLARLRVLGGEGEAPAPDVPGGAPGGEGVAHGGEGGAHAEDAGWSAVPRVFPQGAWDPVEAGVEVDTDAEEALLSSGVAEVQERFGVTRDLSSLGWTMRGGRAWMHTLSEWPLAAWEVGDWRPISVGIRAVEFDSLERARPTNDFLRWLDGGVTNRVLEVNDAELDALLRRAPVPTEVQDRGPYALRFEGDVVGRGAVTKDGLKSEIPKARAADLRRIRESL
ncbi:MAG: RsmB/NOP family class I SAM-dependent RNA methyltransferase [Longimicrobiales bacterium]|nr:RsmB/NOP family class I SAM-dependent RNA methyltransferase [Longimicrobiales bacterium]